MITFDTFIGDCAPRYIILVIGLSFVVAVIEIVNKYASLSVDIRKSQINNCTISQFIYIFLGSAIILIALSLINILFDLRDVLRDITHMLIKIFLLLTSVLSFIIPIEYHKAYKERLAIQDVVYKE